ncbi:hypothetical protein [Streptomyces sp. NBC_00572]|uniref:hypothetical protein n=1 Tax=Streptomyces sp. NBC_00572 TaxID=2903664 RepID=UPI00225B3B25|nr:hypothetical protein [Streptomyces sp. NBC_00572]MCX4981491.1 hypothetical protein [Streptomyces sp. NBC_00572]
MAEPISLAVASLVAGGFLAEAGSGAWRTATRLAAFLRGKFGTDQEAVEVLEQCEVEPSNEAARNRLLSAIESYLGSDSAFRDELLSTLESEGYARDDVVNDRISISGHANVGKVVQIKTVQGDVSF